LAVKLRRSLLTRFLLNPWGKAFLLTFSILLTLGLGTFTYFYAKYAKLIEAKLAEGPFAKSSLLYAAPQPISVGDQIKSEEIATFLRRSGYSDSNSSRMGWYKVREDAVEVNPGADSFTDEGAVIRIEKGKVTEIISQRDHSARTQYLLEPELISNLFDAKREKRRLVHFNDIPKVLVNAVLSAEDKHFFQHGGFDPFGILRALWVDLRRGGNRQGASTLTQQLARSLWLGTERGWRRKIPETLITLHLEQKLTKEQIFEYYSNTIDIGHQGSFSINGFGEGAQIYFGKDLSQITLPEAALLAGLPQAPQTRNPYRHPDKAVARRNAVLKAMRENGYINEAQYEEAASTPLKVNREFAEASEAPYFVDMLNDSLQSKFGDRDFENGAYRVYTTLDMNLQRDAVEAIRIGIEETDARWKRRNKKYGTDEMPLAQVAMIVLDAQTGEIKALSGGRSYGVSQLNHALARRQPGSSFKPFVYTAAMVSAIDGSVQPPLTPASTVEDEPTTFYFDNKPYEPENHDKKYHGTVTFREALMNSWNIPAVKVAEMVGYKKVAMVARQAGLNVDIRATPSIALGAYEVTPLEIAGAYTVFANSGTLIKPSFISAVRDADGTSVFQNTIEKKQVLDPRAVYLVENMMEDVLNRGTGAGVRGRGFYLPAAGKTGTSRDAWFAGFTSKLICVVWVGFDDNRDIKLEGAQSALPIWTEFMKRAHQHRAYRNVHAIQPPDGIVTAQIDQETGELAAPSCPKVRSEVFLAGTQPVQLCHVHGNGRTMVTSWDLPDKNSGDTESSPTVAGVRGNAPRKGHGPRSIPVNPQGGSADQTKHGFLGRLKDIFK
jgi:penicillin-binding protein 1B